MVLRRPDLESTPDEVFTSFDTNRDALRAVYELQDSMEASAPQIGDVAPDFELPTLLADRSLGATMRLSDRRGRPVALIFGSYT